ncbi:MAG: CpaD family pilus assembly protein [Nitratireductor sp.]
MSAPCGTPVAAHRYRSCRDRGRRDAGRLRQARFDHGRIGAGRLPDQSSHYRIRAGRGARPARRPVRARHDRVQRVAVDGYVSNYDRGAGAVISIMVPANSANAASASSAAYEIAGYMQRKGIPAGRIVTVPYDAGAPDQTAPIRLVHGRMKAHVGQCGRWPDDLLKTRENKHYANFGCAYQNNLAAQLANPSDLLGPRASTEIDAANRGVAIEDYQSRKTEWTPVTQY